MKNLTWLLIFAPIVLTHSTHIPPPTAITRNGTIQGIQLPFFQQDLFLGIPYAQQPVGSLRFNVPQSLNQTWPGSRDAKAYSDVCVGYGVSTS